MLDLASAEQYANEPTSGWNPGPAGGGAEHGPTFPATSCHLMTPQIKDIVPPLRDKLRASRARLRALITRLTTPRHSLPNLVPPRWQEIPLMNNLRRRWRPQIRRRERELFQGRMNVWTASWSSSLRRLKGGLTAVINLGPSCCQRGVGVTEPDFTRNQQEAAGQRMKTSGIFCFRSSSASSTGWWRPGCPVSTAPPASIAAKFPQSSCQCVFVCLSKLIFQFYTLCNQPPVVKMSFRSHWKSSSHPPLIARFVKEYGHFFSLS